MASTESAVNLDQSNRWSAFKNLLKVVNRAVSSKDVDDINELESALRKHRADFLTLLKNPPRSDIHKEAVIQSVKDGISIIRHQKKSRKTIPRTIAEEAVLMSEMFNLNELVSLELIVTGDHQLPRYPGMARGPVAVMLYYDAKKSLLLSLKTLLQAVSGRTWASRVTPDSNRTISSFLSELNKEQIVERVLDNLRSFNIERELDILQKNKGLGPGKFKSQVYDLIREIRELYSYIVFAFSAQFTLPSGGVSNLVSYIATHIQPPPDNKPLDYVATNIILAFMSTLDTLPVQTLSEEHESVTSLPIIKNRTLLRDIVSQITTTRFADPRIQNILSLICGMSCKSLTSASDSFDDITSGINEDALIDESIDRDVFEILRTLLILSPHLKADDFFGLRVHHLLTDIPYLLPQKVRELREKGDENGRMMAAYAQQGLVTNLSLTFDRFLCLLADFYDLNGGEFCHDLFNSHDAMSKFGVFNKFLKSSLETYSPHVLHVSLLRLLSSLAKTNAFQIFSLLKSSAPHQNPQFSLDQFFKSFHAYSNILRGVSSHFSDSQGFQESISFGRHLDKTDLNHKNITPAEIDILCATLKLIENIASNDRNCAQALSENQSYNCVQTFVGLISMSIPRNLKASLLSCLAGFCRSSPSVALNVWLVVEHILPRPQVAVGIISATGSNRQSALCFDIEDIEPRNEDYAVTRSFLQLVFDALPHVSPISDSNRQVILENTINFVANNIFLKLDSRIFKQESDKWSIASLCLDIIHFIVDSYDPLANESANRSAFSLMTQLLQENVLFRGLMSIIEHILTLLEPETKAFRSFAYIVEEKCLVASLRIVGCFVKKYQDFFRVIRTIQGFPSAALMSPPSLFCNVNPRTGETDRLATLIRLTAIPSVEVQQEALDVLRTLIREENSLSHLSLLQCQTLRKYHEDYLLHGFVDCIESDDSGLRRAVLELILNYVSMDMSSPGSYGLAHRLLGFDRKMQLREPGSLDQTFTCFHSIVSSLDGDTSPEGTEERTICLQIIIAITKNPDIRPTVLRFLRTSYDLMTHYLTIHHNWFSGKIETRFLREVACFYQLLSEELKTTQGQDLKSHSEQCTRILLGERGDRKLVNLIPQIVLSHTHPEMPAWEFFDAGELWKTIASCSEGNIQIKYLKSRLMTEVKHLTPHLASAQAGQINNEVKRVISFVEKLNQSRDELESKVLFFKGWRDLVETLISCKCLHTFDDGTRGVLLLDLIHGLTHLALSSNLVTALLVPMSSVVLLATCHLRESPDAHVTPTHLITTATSIMHLLESAQLSELWSQSQRARINLYGALLHVSRSLPKTSSVELVLSKRLVSKLSKDSLDGIELIKVLSISLLHENQSSWMEDLATDGSLQLLINSLVTDDRDMKANKCQRLSKAFFSFESKMSLLMKAATTERGARLLVHLGVVDVLSSLECVEIYTYLLNQNEVCYQVFVSVFRLLVTLCDSCPPSDIDIISRFLTCKSPVVYGMLKTPESYRQTEEGRVVLGHVMSLLSRLFLYANLELQKSFISFINLCINVKDHFETDILLHVLQGCIRFIRVNKLTPLFVASWDSREAFVATGQPPLGSLIFIVDQCAEKGKSSRRHAQLLESCLYLLFHHYQLYISAEGLTVEESRAVADLKKGAPSILSEQFFSRIQRNVENTFVQAMIRRLKRCVTFG